MSQKEVQALNYLKGKVTLRIPEIEYYSEEYGVCGYKEIKGDKLTPVIYKNMSDDEKDKLVRDIALFLREILWIWRDITCCVLQMDEQGNTNP